MTHEREGAQVFDFAAAQAAKGFRSEPWVDTKHLAAHFGVTEQTIRRWRRLGMPSKKFNRGARRYKVSLAEAWAEK